MSKTEFEYGINWRHWTVGVMWSVLYLTFCLGPFYFGWWFNRPDFSVDFDNEIV